MPPRRRRCLALGELDEWRPCGRRLAFGELGGRRGGRDRDPAETAGPFPGDGSNGVHVLTESGIVRGDITRSFGSASGVAEGVPLTSDMVFGDGWSLQLATVTGTLAEGLTARLNVPV